MEARERANELVRWPWQVLDHLDAHWRHIVAEAGPLHLCTTQQHTQATQRSLAAIPVPPGWFDPPSSEPDSSAEAVA